MLLSAHLLSPHLSQLYTQVRVRNPADGGFCGYVRYSAILWDSVGYPTDPAAGAGVGARQPKMRCILAAGCCIQQVAWYDIPN